MVKRKGRGRLGNQEAGDGRRKKEERRRKATGKLHETVRGNEKPAERASHHDATADVTCHAAATATAARTTPATVCPAATTDDGNLSTAAATNTGSGSLPSKKELKQI